MEGITSPGWQFLSNPQIASLAEVEMIIKRYGQGLYELYRIDTAQRRNPARNLFGHLPADDTFPTHLVLVWRGDLFICVGSVSFGLDDVLCSGAHLKKLVPLPDATSPGIEIVYQDQILVTAADVDVVCLRDEHLNIKALLG